MIFLVILLVIIIFWLQYSQYDDKDKPKSKYMQVFNLIKTPIVVICFIILIFSAYSCKKPSLNAYVSVPKY